MATVSDGQGHGRIAHMGYDDKQNAELTCSCQSWAII